MLKEGERGVSRYVQHVVSTMIFPFPFSRTRTRILLFFSRIPRREISSRKLVLQIQFPKIQFPKISGKPRTSFFFPLCLSVSLSVSLSLSLSIQCFLFNSPFVCLFLLELLFCFMGQWFYVGTSLSLNYYLSLHRCCNLSLSLLSLNLSLSLFLSLSLSHTHTLTHTRTHTHRQLMSFQSLLVSLSLILVSVHLSLILSLSVSSPSIRPSVFSTYLTLTRIREFSPFCSRNKDRDWDYFCPPEKQDGKGARTIFTRNSGATEKRRENHGAQ